MHGQSAATAHAMCMNAWASILCIAAVAHLVRCTSYHVILTLTDNTEAYALSISCPFHLQLCGGPGLFKLARGNAILEELVQLAE